MPDLTLIQKYDSVLTALYDISGKRPTFKRLLAILRVRNVGIEWAEVWDILIKMEKEGFIHPGITDKTSKIPTEVIHLITIDGKIFHEKGGLKGKIERDKPSWHLKHPILYGLLAGLGGGLLSIGVSVITDKVSKQEKTQELQQIKQTTQDASRRLDSLIAVQKNINQIKSVAKDSGDKIGR